MKMMLAAVLIAVAATMPEPAASDLGWMAGRWESASGDRWTEEYWSAPRGGVMIGYSRTGEGETLREFEFIRIAPAEDGALVYQASPGGGPAVPFRLIERNESSATFANPAHDYPQRIVYRRDGDTMVATISTSEGGDAMSWNFRRAD
jgi:hypothetical protein